MIVAGQQQGLVKEVSADILLSYLIGAVNEIVKVHFDKNIQITQATIQACFEMSWHSIKR